MNKGLARPDLAPLPVEAQEEAVRPTVMLTVHCRVGLADDVKSARI